MADQIDNTLRNYYTGRIDLMIKQREYVIRNESGPADDNIGGGTALNKHTRPVDDMLIRIQSDSLLNRLIRQKEDIERWIATFERDKQDVMRCYYSSKSITWEKVAQQCHVGESTARAYRADVKHILATVL